MIVPEFKLEWMDPPSPAQAAYEPILRDLKARAGVWARVQTNRSTTSGVAMWKKQGCEARHHRTNPGQNPARYDIYVRWPAVKSSNAGHPDVVRVDRPAISPADAARQANVDAKPAPSAEAERIRREREARGVGVNGKPVTSLHRT